MEDVQKEIEKFSEERDWDQFHSPENLAKSIAIESGINNKMKGAFK